MRTKIQMMGTAPHTRAQAPDFNGKGSLKGQNSGLPRSFLFLMCLVCLGVGINRAQEASIHGQVHLFPPATGEALTLAPKDLPDIGCSVLKWNEQPPAPTLAILCPPQNIFAPLYVYVKLSWLKPEDVPSSAHDITAQTRSLTKIRTNESAICVWLDVREKQGVPLHKAWVAFNAVEDFALLSRIPKR